MTHPLYILKDIDSVTVYPALPNCESAQTPIRGTQMQHALDCVSFILDGIAEADHADKIARYGFAGSVLYRLQPFINRRHSADSLWAKRITEMHHRFNKLCKLVLFNYVMLADPPEMPELKWAYSDYGALNVDIASPINGEPYFKTPLIYHFAGNCRQKYSLCGYQGDTIQEVLERKDKSESYAIEQLEYQRANTRTALFLVKSACGKTSRG